MKIRKGLIAVAVLVLFSVPGLYYFAESKPQGSVSGNTALAVGNVVSVAGSIFSCPSLTAMDALHEDSVSHDEIGFRNHFDLYHCRDRSVGPERFRILKFATGESGSLSVKMRTLKSGADNWFPYDAGAFLRQSDH